MIVVITTAIVIVATIIVTAPGSRFLVLTNARNGAVLLKHPIYEYDIFAISYVHSVNKSTVVELFQIRQDQIILTALEFETFGAGMPTELEPGQVMIHLPEGRMRIEGFNRHISNLQILIGYDTYHTLHLGEQSIPLNTLADPGYPVKFTVGRFLMS